MKGITLGRNHTRFKMLTRWLTFTVFLAVSANPGRAANGTLTVASTCQVKGHPEVELTLNCGDGKDLGVVQYWHTPFGDLQAPGFHSKLDPVFMHHDGSLVVPNTSVLHSGLYYCLLQHTEGTTLWPYELHIGHDSQNNQEHSEYEQSSSCAAFRLRRDAGSEEKTQAGVSDDLFAGAVAASVLLTFVLGFSAGALSRTHVLRCLGAVRVKLQSPMRRRRRQTDTPDHGPAVSMTTVPPMYENQAFDNDQVMHDDSATTLSPPAKPQRSFRHKRDEEEQPETTAYLEGCDYMKKEEEEEGRCAEERNKDSDKEVAEEEEEREFGSLYLLGEGGGSQRETDEDKEDKDESVSREEKLDLTQEEEEEDIGEEERIKGKDGSESREEKLDLTQEEERSEEKDGEREISGDSEKSSTETEDDGRGGNNQEATVTNKGEPSPSTRRPARRSRVIRLYQYDDDGQRYGHLPDPTLDAPVPAPRLKQRSVSLTRLSTIMAAASAGPLDESDTGREDSEKKSHFHMDI